MTDQDVIQRFYEQIAWADQCHQITHSERTLLATPNTLAIPSHWQYYQENKAFIIPIAQEYSLLPELIIWGNPSEYDTEKICWQVIPHGVNVVFIDVRARLTYSRFILRGLDGANLQKTFENFMAGKGEVVWSWQEEES